MPLSLQECYVKEIDTAKENVILINKADLLTAEQRLAWASYFEKEGVKVIFWSALGETLHSKVTGTGGLSQGGFKELL